MNPIKGRYDAPEAKETQPTHTPTLEHSHDYTRVLNCKRCAYESRAVNTHEALLECLKWTQGMTTEQGWKTFDAWAKKVIAQAEEK